MPSVGVSRAPRTGTRKPMNHFLSITDLTVEGVQQIFALAKALKREVKMGVYRDALAQKTLVMLFEKPSLRTRLSFEVAMTQLGGHAVYLGPDEVGLGTRESVADVARVASSMGDMLLARVFAHSTVFELAKHAGVPVINGLSDWEHPCQILADLFTIRECKKKIQGLKLAFLGDGENNVAHSLVLAGVIQGMDVSVASPKGYEVKDEIFVIAEHLTPRSGAVVSQTNDPMEAAAGADIVYTDTWVSMGDEADRATRLRVFAPYQVNSWMLSHAKADAIFMHDMPCYRGREVTEDVMDGAQSVVFQQAENRLHVQKALLLWLFGKSDQ